MRTRTLRTLLCCALVLLTQYADAETDMERSNRILKEVNERVVNQYRAPPTSFDNLPKPAVQPNPADISQQFRLPSVQPKITTPELMVFVSFSLPDKALQRIVEQAEKMGARLVFRGLKGDKLTDMAQHIATLIGKHRVEAIVHPPAFAQFKVTQVPALVIAQSNAAEQMESGCALPDRYVKVTGDVSQDYALAYIERTSPQWATAAHLFAEKLKVEQP